MLKENVLRNIKKLQKDLPIPIIRFLNDLLVKEWNKQKRSKPKQPSTKILKLKSQAL